MIKGTIYSTTTGRIVMTTMAPDENGVRLQCSLNPDYQAHIGEELDGLQWYFPGGVKTERPSMGLVIENGTPNQDNELDLAVNEILRVTNIPAGTLVRYPDGEIVVDDGFIEWYTDQPGYYRFFFSNGTMREVLFDAVVA